VHPPEMRDGDFAARELPRAGASRGVALLLLDVRAGSCCNFRPAAAQGDSLFHVEQESFCRKVTVPAPTLIQLHQIRHTTICEQTPFLRDHVEVRATCLRHEEAPCDGEERVRDSIVAASRTQRHHEAGHIPNRKTKSQFCHPERRQRLACTRVTPARVQQRERPL
jgi:hypothetical protein